MTIGDVERIDAQQSGRELTGPETFWEDLHVGDTIVSTGMTMTEAHFITWAGLTGDIVSLHLDEQYAATTQFGARIGHGPLTMALGLGLVTQTGYLRHVTAWLGVDEVRAKKPVFLGDTIHAEATIAEARPTKKPQNGVWRIDYDMRNQRDETVMTFTSSFLIARRPSDEPGVA